MDSKEAKPPIPEELCKFARDSEEMKKYTVMDMCDNIRSTLKPGTEIAHIFSTGWAVGTCRKFHPALGTEGQWDVYYTSDRTVWPHDMSNPTYGINRNWVILHK